MQFEFGRLSEKQFPVLDEATDSSIQKTLRQHFSDSTVITIAHRITSVLDSDMVLLLDNGVAVEHQTPAKLLDDLTSHRCFRSLCWNIR